MQASHKTASNTRSAIAFTVCPCAIGISQLRITFRCGNGRSGAKGLAIDGSESVGLKWFDMIRINKLGANDSLFHEFTHDVGQNPPVLVRPAGIEPATLGFGGQYSIH